MTDVNTDLQKIMAKTVGDSRAWSLSNLQLGKACRILFLNAHGVNMAAENDDFRAAMLSADHLLRDGIGVSLGLKMLGLEETENLNGTDLIPKILGPHKDRKIAVWGSSEAALDALRSRLEVEGFSGLQPFEHGFHEDAFYLDAYARTRPEILVLCMGMPRQEVLSTKLIEAGAGGLIICGGGWANFYSGHQQRAPEWVQKLRLEWLHRLSREPKRLGKRYTVDIFRYFRRIRQLNRQMGQ